LSPAPAPTDRMPEAPHPDPNPQATPDAPLPVSAQENLEVMADLYEREDAGVTRLRSAIECIGDRFGTPGYFLFAVTFVIAWVVINSWGRLHGWRHFDEPPFFWLQGLVSTNALLLTVSVLIRQNRMVQLAEHRAHLDLQINMLTERKVTKALELIDAMRRQLLKQEKDAAVDELIKPADPEAIMIAIKKTDAKVDGDSTAAAAGDAG
jgi:uncharacterized membrane protein